MNDDNTILRPIDEQLNNIIAGEWIKASEALVNDHHDECYRHLKTIFASINPYDFESKKTLTDFIEAINEVRNQLGGQAMNKKQEILIGQKTFEYKQLIDHLFLLIPQALSDLNKWMKIIKKYGDMDEQISAETFDTNITLFDSKKKMLKKLSVEELLALMNPNHVHHAHSRLLINLAVDEGRL